jgi:hypothetical protein
MKKKKAIKKVILTVLISIIFIPSIAILGFWIFSGRPSFGSIDNTRTLPDDFFEMSQQLEGYAADALYLVQMIENIHPIFIIDGWLPDDYEAIRDEFLAYTKNDITEKEFTFAANKYINTLRDGHMNNGFIIEIDDGVWMPVLLKGGRFSELLTAHEGRLFLSDENQGLDNAEVISIGGIMTAQIFPTINTYFYAENEIDRQRNYTVFSRYADVIERAGGEISNGVIQLYVHHNGEYTMLESIVDLPTASSAAGNEFIINYEMIGDIFLIDLRAFNDGDHITEAVNAIKQAVSNGTDKFIIDLRNNGGGNSLVGNRLLEAMGIKVPSFGAVMRINDAAAEQRGFWYLRPLGLLGFDYLYSKPSIPANLNPNNVFVSVLTNTNTYSSATMMSAWVQDGAFGNVIGSPSHNAPNAFGNMLSFFLPHSGIYFRISDTQWLRPDINADPIVLWPDIMVTDGDALEVALEYLQNQNR